MLSSSRKAFQRSNHLFFPSRSCSIVTQRTRQRRLVKAQWQPAFVTKHRVADLPSRLSPPSLSSFHTTSIRRQSPQNEEAPIATATEQQPAQQTNFLFPKSALYQLYIERKMKEQDMSRIEFEDDTQADDGVTWWTTKLFCPLSNRHFDSVIMKEFPSMALSERNPIKTLIDKDGRVFYNRRKMAHHAAATAALEYLLSTQNDKGEDRNELSSVKEDQVNYEEGEEERADLSETNLMASKDDSNRLFRKGRSVKSQQQHAPTSCEKDDSATSTTVIATKTAKGLLVEQVTAKLGSQEWSVTDSFSKERVRIHDGTMLYTSTFTDPSTSRVYRSGWQKDVTSRIYYEERSIVKENDDDKDEDQHDQKITIFYYPHGKTAEHAAAAQWLDEHSESSGNESRCWHIPSGIIDDKEALWKDRMMKLNLGPKDKEDQAWPTSIEESLLLASSFMSPTSALIEDSVISDMEFLENEPEYAEEHEDEDEDDLVITALSPATSAVDRLMEAWSDGFRNSNDTALKLASSSESSTVANPHTELETIGLPLLLSPIDDRRRARRMADDWVKKMEQRKRAADFLGTSAIGSGILRTLAVVDDTGNQHDHDLGHLASRVLSLIPDRSADNYNDYLLCLDPDPKNAVDQAGEILDAMMEQERPPEHVFFNTNNASDTTPLPKPNQRTFLILMELWMKVGGSLGQTKTAEIADMMESKGFPPTRESFELQLIANAIPSCTTNMTYFDVDIAMGLVKQAEESKLGINLDTDLFNASLGVGSQNRWDNPERSGSREKLERRETDQDSLEKMELWLDEGISRGVADIRSYEAVIQAWSRRPTAENLGRAGRLLEKATAHLLAKGEATPMQLYHPILSALLRLGKADVLREWYGRILHHHGAESRMRAFAILALRREQEEHTQAKDLDAIKENARKSLCLLEALARDVKVYHRRDGQPLFLEAETVKAVVETCGEVLKFSSDNSDSQYYMNAIKIFDKCIQQLRRLQSDNERPDPRLGQQIDHLSSNLCGIYGTALSFLTRSAQVRKDSIDIEGYLRASKGNHVICSNQHQSVVFSDGFSYRLTKSTYEGTNQISFLCTKALECAQNAGPNRKDLYSMEKVRLCYAVFDLLMSSTSGRSVGGRNRMEDAKTSTELLSKMLRVIGSNVPNESDKVALLRHIRNLVEADNDWGIDRQELQRAMDGLIGKHQSRRMRSHSLQ